ncbi:MAG: PDZ domain-containing protein, partial [Coriobacteriia bacterium]|nr:PDZ domain-containing protein [Coriobacteriia bacterium]
PQPAYQTPPAPARPPAPPVPPLAPPAPPYASEQAEPFGEQPLPVCDYTTESDEPCEEPAQEKRWAGASVVIAAALGAIVGGVFVAGTLVWVVGMLPGMRSPLAARTTSASTVQSVTISPSAIGTGTAEVVATKVVPSVVNIKLRQQVTNPYTGAVSTRSAGNGSGVIIRSDGYVLTNNHVIEGADDVLVTVGLEDKPAKVIGIDPSTDLAVLKIEGTDYPAIEMGSSKDLRVGQFVMAVGSPFGLEKTVTSGIISALQRSEQVQAGYNDLTTYTNLIQTDAAINPGNSGGALVDELGRLVGVNTLIQSPSGGVGAAQSAGIGFAIPADFAASIAEQLISTGKASHPYMGVTTQTIDERIAEQYQLPVKNGAIVAFVQPDGPADKAGVAAGDIITSIGDTQIGSVADTFAAIRAHKIGDTVTVEAMRDETARTFQVTLGSDAAPQ